MIDRQLVSYLRDIRKRFPHLRGLPLHEVLLRDIEDKAYVLGREPTEVEIAQVVNSSGAFLFRSIIYKNITAAASKFGIKDTSTIFARAKLKNCSLAEALEHLLSDNKQTKINPFVFRGETYRSVCAACKAVGLNSDSIGVSARRLGISKQEVMELRLSNTKSYVFRGETFKSIMDICLKYGAPFHTVYSRMNKKGETLQEAIDHALSGALQNRPRIKVTYQGVDYSSLTQACQLLGVSNYRINARLAAGESMHQAITNELQNPSTVRHRQPFTFLGVEYSTRSHACRVLGVSIQSVKIRVARGETPEEAISHLLSNNKRTAVPPIQVTFRGVRYPSLKNACRALGIASPSTVRRLILHGEPVEEAIRLAITNAGRGHGKVYVRGVEYPSFEVACRDLGVSPASARKRLKVHGGTHEQVIEHFLSKLKKAGQSPAVQINQYDRCRINTKPLNGSPLRLP